MVNINQIINLLIISMRLQVLISDATHSLKVIPQVLTDCILIGERGEISLLGRNIAD